jgi:hypothetical protein
VADFIDPSAEFEQACRAFEAYGYAMAAASVFEIVMRLMLIEQKARVLPRMSDQGRREAEQARYSRKVFRANFGTLVQWVIQSTQLPEGLATDLRAAKDSRDHLAHFFWQANIGHLGTEPGVDLIAAECNLTAQFFNHLADRLRVATGVDIEQYKEFIRNRTAELFHENPLAHLVD